MEKSLKISAILSIIAIAISGIGIGYMNMLISGLSDDVSRISETVDMITEVPEVSDYLGLSPERRKIIEEARKEGEVTLYTSWAAEKAQPMLDIFKEKYPFIKTNLYRASAWKLATKIEAEAAAGKHIADVIMFAGEQFLYLKGLGIVPTVYESPEAISRRPIFIGPDYEYIVERFSPSAPMVNTELVPEELEPKDWIDFANPKPEWKGKICMGDPRVLGTSYTILYTLWEKYGEETCREIYGGLKETEPMFFTGHTQGAEMVATGERPIAFQMLTDRFVAFKDAGAPVKWIWPTSGVITWQTWMCLPKNMPHPNAAKLLYDTLLSEEEAEYITTKGMYSTRTGSEPPPYCEPTIDDLQLITFDVATSTEMRDYLLEEFKKIFELP